MSETPGRIARLTVDPNEGVSIIGKHSINGLTMGSGGGSISTNTAVGSFALHSNTTGGNNVAIGYRALYSNTTGAGNIGIGSRTASGVDSPVFDTTTQNNRIAMGSTAVTHAYVQVAWTVAADQRDKMNFASVPHGLNFVRALQPVAYRFRINRNTEQASGPVRYGFKAQDVLALEGANAVIIDNENSNQLRCNTEALIPVLVNAVKELSAMFDSLQSELDAHISVYNAYINSL